MDGSATTGAALMNRYKVLIVDDEKLARDGLHRHFPWQQYGLEVAGEAGNGLEACEFIKEHPVDLVITDVCMKQMDGIELTRYLNKCHPKIKVIFISGYDDLDYLKDALKLDAVDYILKAIDFDELGTTLLRVRKKMDDERLQMLNLKQLEAQLKQSMPLLRDQLLVQLIRNDIMRDSEIEGRLSFLGIRLDEERRYRLAVVRLTDFYRKLARNTERERYLLCMQIRAILDSIVSQNTNNELFFSNAEDEWILVSPDSEQADVEALARCIVDRITAETRLQAKMCLSNPFYGYTGMKEGYESALRLLMKGSESAERRMLTDAEDSESNLREVLKSSLFTAVNSEDRDEIDDLAQQLRQIENKDCLKSVLFFLMIEMNHLAEVNRLASRAGDNMEQIRRFEAFFYARQSEEMIGSVLSMIEKMSHEIQAKKGNQASLAAISVKEYINENYTRDISLTDIAASVYLTPSYVSELFKNQTGMTIRDYIAHLRVARAKELLKDPRVKLYDVGTMIGIESSSYFTRLFKKQTGMTPSEYRRIDAGNRSEKREA